MTTPPATPANYFYGNQNVISTGSRGSRYLAVSNLRLSATEVEPLLEHFSWAVESRATAPLRSTTIKNQYAVTVQWQMRYAFKQVVSKKFTTTLSGAAMAAGFDFSSTASGGQTYAYADPRELQVFRVPQIFDDTYFEGGKREWTMDTWDVSMDTETGISTLIATLTAYTIWMPLTSISSKCVLPSLATIRTVPNFPA